VDEDVASAVSIEHELGGAAYVICVAQVDDDISGAVEDDHGMVGCQARDDRAADGTGAAGDYSNTTVCVAFAGHQKALRSLGLSIGW
jgi:hypothetical protein